MRIPLTSLLIAFGIVRHVVNTVAFSTHPTILASVAHRKSLQRRGALNAISLPHREKQDRFEQSAPTSAEIDVPCLLTIHNKTYDLSAWAKAHPGGVKVLQKFHGKDATRAFEAAGHSHAAYEMLKDFEVVADSDSQDNFVDIDHHLSCPIPMKIPRWRAKLFTKEDPIGIHKYAGVFVLLHYIFRFGQLYFGDPSAGFGSRLGKGTSIAAPLCLIPHLILSLSSLIFHTVPRERVVGKPMIWSEFRAHSITFACRSAMATFLAWLSVAKNHAPAWRRFCVTTSALSILVANFVADAATRRLRVHESESTTATMPYWPGCSIETQRRFKQFYAYSQFLATLSCLALWNPAFGFAVMMPIQIAALLMTLVRKGIISARTLHMTYTVSLCMPYAVGFRSVGFKFVPFLGLGWILYQLRRRGVSKYAMWTSLAALRIAFGDSVIDYAKW